MNAKAAEFERRIGYLQGARDMQAAAIAQCVVKNMLGQDSPIAEVCAAKIRSINPETL